MRYKKKKSRQEDFDTEIDLKEIEIEWREKIKKNTIKFIKKALKKYEQITFKQIMDKTEIKLEELETLLEIMIYNEELDAEIRGNILFFKN
ncbi:MAG: PCI domain-containing protein [Promethearchaeota archaeon]